MRALLSVSVLALLCATACASLHGDSPDGLRIDVSDSKDPLVLEGAAGAPRLRHGDRIIATARARADGPLEIQEVDGDRRLIASRDESLWLRADDSSVRFEVRRERDGDVELFRAGEGKIGKLKRRKYGYKAKGAKKKTVGKLRRDEGRLRVSDRQGEIRAQSDAPIAPEALALLFFFELDRFERAALALAIHELGAPEATRKR